MSKIKSERAFKHLQSTAMHPNSPLAKDQDYVWRDASIIHAIELAEQDARERAVKAFCEVCPNHTDCHSNRTEIVLDRCDLHNFLNHYENEK